MSKQSDKSRYRSAYDVGDNFITAAQYIVEKLCELKAKKNGTSLRVKFWQEPEWNKEFRGQIKAANDLLKEFSPEAILSTIKDKRFWKIASLRAKKAIAPICAEYQAAFQAALANEEDKGCNSYTKPRVPLGKQTIIDKLRSMDE